MTTVAGLTPETLEQGYGPAFDEDRSLAALRALQPRLVDDADVVRTVTESLVAAGHAEIAEAWLTEVLEPALRRREELEGQGRPEPAYPNAASAAFALLVHRHDVRQGLDRPHDGYDDLADRLMDKVAGLPEATDHGTRPVALLYWPHGEYERLVSRWPVLAQTYGGTWGDHRAYVESGLVRLSEAGHTGLALAAGSVDELAGFARRHGEEDPTAPATRQRYVEHLSEHPCETAWPPGRNSVCWCGSTRKYKQCCRPRSRRLGS